MRNIPIVTKNLLIVNVVAFLACLVMGKNGTDGYVLNDILGLHFFMASDFHIYQLFTYMFMHGGFEHILFNMFALWMFGCVVERVWGPKKFLFYYIACGVGAGLFQEAAVNVDLAKFVFDQHQLFALVGFRQQLFDECGLTGTQEAGDDVDFCHGISPFQKFYTTVIIPRNHKNATPSQKIYSSSGTKKHFCTTGAIFRTFAVSETFFLAAFLPALLF